ncbi:flagellar protein FlaG [Pseudomonadales bacterium]|nr:flagellar protein FlaG [Pseudomonadales bacterium]MDB2509486.1 flagellar protein FlaG [Pseudomonadales bacterium]
MEINSSASVQGANVAAQPAKVAASGPGNASVAGKLPTVEIKAPPKAPEYKPQDLDKAVQELQAFVEGLDRSLSFRRDESVDRSIITVRDANTNQLVRQIPAEEIVEIARQIRQDLDAKRAGMLLRGEV